MNPNLKIAYVEKGVIFIFFLSRFKKSHAHLQYTNSIYAKFQIDCLYILEELITQTC